MSKKPYWEHMITWAILIAGFAATFFGTPIKVVRAWDDACRRLQAVEATTNDLHTQFVAFKDANAADHTNIQAELSVLAGHPVLWVGHQ